MFSDGRVQPTDAATSVLQSLSTHGNYSVERMLALDEYTSTRSPWHMLAVILRTPLVPFLVTVVYEMPPLASPLAGWRANWVFLVVRLGGGLFIVSECGITISIHIIPELSRVLTRHTRLAISVFSASVYVGSAILLSAVWGFPVPFLTTLCNPSSGGAFILAILVASRSIVVLSETIRRRFLHLCFYTSLPAVLKVVYPAYVAVFLAVDDNYPQFQPLVTLVVPAFKLVLRKAVARIIADWEDLIPAMANFSLEFFNAMFQVICVQSGGSMVTTATIMALDVVQIAWSQSRLHKQSQTLRRFLNEHHHESSTHRSLLSLVTASCDQSAATAAALPAEKFRRIKLQSTLRHCGLSTDGEKRLRLLYSRGLFHAPSWVDKATHHPQVDYASAKVSPHEQRPVEAVASDTDQGVVLIEAAHVLFRSEHLVLHEYIEWIVPCVYSTNLVLMSLSPNARFYPHLRAIAPHDELRATTVAVSVLFALELVSFVGLCLVLWKRLRLSPLHQLSYVLEHQASVIQAVILIVFVMSLQFNLGHVGNDYSFRFMWLHR